MINVRPGVKKYITDKQKKKCILTMHCYVYLGKYYCVRHILNIRRKINKNLNLRQLISKFIHLMVNADTKLSSHFIC